MFSNIATRNKATALMWKQPGPVILQAQYTDNLQNICEVVITVHFKVVLRNCHAFNMEYIYTVTICVPRKCSVILEPGNTLPGNV